MKRFRVLLVILLTVPLAVLPFASPSYAITCAASECHWYVGERATGLNATGLDGYINGMASSGMGSSRGFVDWVGLTQVLGGVTYWGQLGQYQGSVWNFGVPSAETAIHQYYENNEPCGYAALDLGTPPAPNYAYYVTRSATVNASCYTGGTSFDEYTLYFRRGSFANAPFALGAIPVGANTYPETNMEVVALQGTVSPGVYRQYFGLNSAHTQSAGNALHVQMSGSWKLWTSGNLGSGTATYGNPPYMYKKIGAGTDYAQYSADDG